MGADRSGRKRFYLYPSETSLGWRIVRMVSLQHGEAQVNAGGWRRVEDSVTHAHIGYQICGADMSRGDYEMPSTFSPAAMTADEMTLNCERSRTAGLCEDRRLERLVLGRFVPEDRVERVQQKVRVWPLVGSKVGDVLLAWPL